MRERECVTHRPSAALIKAHTNDPKCRLTDQYRLLAVAELAEYHLTQMPVTHPGDSCTIRQ
jgi:hypothetical protein